MAPPVILSQLASGIGVLAGAFVVKSLIESEQSMADGFPRCPTCNGSRRVPCFCTRWSDGDVGCSSCGGSGRMTCNSCGGSGTGRPLPAEIRASRIPESGKRSGS